ncbi:TIGR01621 family pseudouridine synthase [Pasteurella canis]|uniref:RNA pseudouridine synthase n=1 Tax=Pasteurella canis TaxID=753 RepID=A0A379ETT7_9PAST|nr:TIGR01621 family pseudouridine synthase [Pasteurella canis]MXN87734.1 TIGR01621 family pseudouridine synthase [Pasteurella canis]UAX42852.1 TIGR01621 family pseudouridine synthase [Pasteurella canis]UAY78355.1 TIGR01621 family pseudouridine synthase [Pasteurella canis]UEC23977.1 TIGR01621 family pseudouridine synthase [Pasteurella canis]SUC09780.1 RNA pseudouridine synthase [Pasteurella canis]
MFPLTIIYQHVDFVVIDKPYGISVHRDQEEIGLTTLIAHQLNVPRVWLVHRLDKVTSGLLILALNAQAAQTLSQLFAQHSIQKTYLALSSDKPKKKQGLIIGDMDRTRRGMWKLCSTKSNPAITRFYSISCEPHLRLFILQPKTGKTHQLRVAMKSLGSPILGDQLYGRNSPEIDRTYLHAYRLQFYYQGQHIDIQCLPTSGQLFNRVNLTYLLAARSFDY